MSKEKVLDIIFGRWRSQILYAGVKLGVFDALREGPQQATTVATTLALDPTLSYRLLRALGSLGLLKEDHHQTFSLTALGEFLCQDHPETLQGITLLEEGPVHYALWKHLPAMIQEGKQNAFVREFGLMGFAYATQNTEYAAVFNMAMSSYSRMETAMVLAALTPYDFSRCTHLCDVGGGHGHLLCSLLAQYPHLQGTVLERGSVIENRALLWAERMGVGDRCTYVAGDMFTAVPPADAYILKHIIHDWNDEECMQIFSAIHKAAAPDARVLIAEYVVPGPETPHLSKLFDMHMLCWGSGCERTTEEYADLLEKAGWTYRKTWSAPAHPMSVIEGAKV